MISIGSKRYVDTPDITQYVSMDTLRRRAQVGNVDRSDEDPVVINAAADALEALGLYIRSADIERKVTKEDFNFDTRGYPYIYRYCYPINSIENVLFRDGTILPFADIDAEKIYFDISSLNLTSTFGAADIATIKLNVGYDAGATIPNTLQMILGAAFAQFYHTRTLTTQGGDFSRTFTIAVNHFIENIKQTNGNVPLPKIQSN